MPRGILDLSELLDELARLECNEVLVEAGSTLSAQFIKQGLCDELWVYMAPKLMGSDARPMVTWPISDMKEAQNLSLIDYMVFGDDLRLRYRLTK